MEIIRFFSSIVSSEFFQTDIFARSSCLSIHLHKMFSVSVVRDFTRKHFNFFVLFRVPTFSRLRIIGISDHRTTTNINDNSNETRMVRCITRQLRSSACDGDVMMFLSFAAITRINLLRYRWLVLRFFFLLLFLRRIYSG
jgi:hypothetical protein